MQEKSLFEQLYTLDVSSIVEKNYQGIQYISWATAWAKIKEFDPKATFFVHEFGDQKLPYQETPRGIFVRCTVTVKGESATEQLPVMDSTGKAIGNPDARDINDNTKRCLVKALALLGFGLKIYEGEDIYADNGKQRSERAQKPIAKPQPETSHDAVPGQATREKDEYTVPFGKHKGKRLSEIPGLASYISWIKGEQAKSQKPASRDMLQFIEAATTYLEFERVAS